MFSASGLHPFQVHFVCRGSGDQDPQQVVAGITDQVESEMGTKPVRLGPDRVCLSGSVGEEKNSNLLFTDCHPACSKSTITCVAALQGSALAMMGKVRPLSYAKLSGKNEISYGRVSASRGVLQSIFRTRFYLLDCSFIHI